MFTITLMEKEVNFMKKVYNAPQFLEIPAEEFYALITEGYGLKDSCYS